MYDNLLRFVEHFYIIIYARLSKEEEDKSREEQSKSIKNQIEICKRYIDEEKRRFPNCTFEIIANLKDDGISGTTFEREDFRELIRLIEEKRANMVITTDLSRLGRNHVKTDDYIEEWFPEHNVRYVSIIEGVDTYTDCMSNDIAPIINWSNEHFAKLTSKKIKGRFSMLRSEGKWTGGEVPLGYKLDSNLKYHFIVDERGADVVRMIFQFFMETGSCSQVADILTQENVPIPSIIKGSKRDINKDIVELWRPETIKEILTNEVYLGHMVQGKTTRLNHKSKRLVYIPKENWTIVKNTHDPIVTEEQFKLVQSILATHRNENDKSFDYLLRGLLKCPDCGRSIGVQHYKSRANNYTVCNYYRKYGRKKNICTAHRFIYEEVEKSVLKSVADCLKLIDYQHLESKLEQNMKSLNNAKWDEKKILNCKKEISKLEREIDSIYDDKVSGLIDLGQYERAVKSRHQLLKYEKDKLERYEKESEECIDKNIDVSSIINTFLDNPSRSFLSQIIDRITISEDGSVDIYFNFRKPRNLS